jgi:hypothetical protein
VSITNFKNTTGYYAIYAAIWTDFTISNKCGVPLDWRMDYTNSAGVVEFSRGTSTQYMSTGTIDDDWAKFSSNYTVSLTVRSSSGLVLAQNKAGVATKKPKDLLVTVTAAANAADAAANAAYSVYTTAYDAAEAAQTVADADHAKVIADTVISDAATLVAHQADADAASAQSTSDAKAADAAAANDALDAANYAVSLTDPADPTYDSLVAAASWAQVGLDTAKGIAAAAATDADAAALAAVAANDAANAAIAIETADATIAAASSAAAGTAAADRDAAYANYLVLHQAALDADATLAAILAASV